MANFSNPAFASSSTHRCSWLLASKQLSALVYRRVVVVGVVPNSGRWLPADLVRRVLPIEVDLVAVAPCVVYQLFATREVDVLEPIVGLTPSLGTHFAVGCDTQVRLKRLGGVVGGGTEDAVHSRGTTSSQVTLHVQDDLPHPHDVADTDLSCAVCRSTQEVFIAPPVVGWVGSLAVHRVRQRHSNTQSEHHNEGAGEDGESSHRGTSTIPSATWRSSATVTPGVAVSIT